ncbi:PREDICTED: uncharacterized protein LOC109207619 [Nicotiana attenuata]|uniref:uncharacterized protein LOC109207619 n=1 Tax=Nicotiana attenuata TaxID=49451 RepID=UPI0009051122|nr:PREDICTED: uncharacterized protein LOC109207619 [Nicotiana attenuata]
MGDFTKGLNQRSSDVSRKLKESFLEFQAMTWADVHNQYGSKIRIEDDQVGFPSSAKGREKNKERSKDDFHTDIRCLRANFSHMNRPKDAAGGSGPQTASLPTEGQIAVGKIDHCRTKKRYCEYHGTNGHRIGDCRHLRKEVATVLKNGHLREFLIDWTKNNYGRNRDNTEPSKAGEDLPRLTINMIFGGNEFNGVTFSAAKKTKVLITHSKRLWEVAKYDIPSTEEDANGLLLPHNDSLVIYLNVLDFKINCVLVDPGSSDNIIQWRVLEQAKLTRSIIPATKLLVGFNLASVTIRGEILLPMNTERVMKMSHFEVVDGDMGYNIILGRPWLHEMRVVPSMYHQLMKFSTPEGIKQIRGDQPVAREMNAISISSSKGKEHAA